MSNKYEEMARQAKVWNQQVLEQFHTSGGNAGGQFAGMSLLLLHTLGAKSDQPRISPLAYFKDGDHYVIVASKGGAPTNPDWYYNILAHPNEVTIEVGTEHFPVQVTVAESPERDRLFAHVARQSPNLAAYQKETPRTIPVVVLERMK